MTDQTAAEAPDDYQWTTGHLITCFARTGGSKDPNCPCAQPSTKAQQPKEA